MIFQLSRWIVFILIGVWLMAQTAQAGQMCRKPTIEMRYSKEVSVSKENAVKIQQDYRKKWGKKGVMGYVSRNYTFTHRIIMGNSPRCPTKVIFHFANKHTITVPNSRWTYKCKQHVKRHEERHVRDYEKAFHTVKTTFQKSIERSIGRDFDYNTFEEHIEGQFVTKKKKFFDRYEKEVDRLVKSFHNSKKERLAHQKACSGL